MRVPSISAPSIAGGRRAISPGTWRSAGPAPTGGQAVRPVLAVSPHLDDAVLSAGGRIARMTGAGHPVTVFTLFAGLASGPYSPVARRFHEEWGISGDPVSHRREEDLRALGWLGAQAVHGEFPDAIYRTDRTGRWILDDRSCSADRVAHDEADLTTRASERIRALIADLRPSLILTCASVGKHVDHVLTRDAVRAAVGMTGVRLEFWADLPYLEVPSQALDESLLSRAGEHAAVPFPLDAREWLAKVSAVGEYTSQHAALWPGAGSVAQVMREQAENIGSAYGQMGPCELFLDDVAGDAE